MRHHSFAAINIIFGLSCNFKANMDMIYNTRHAESVPPFFFHPHF